MNAPKATRRPTVLTAHGDDRVDEWYWMADRDDPELIPHLEAENEHCAEALAHTKDLQQELFEEMVARIQETDLSVPVRKGRWWYLNRTVEGQQYAILCRRQGRADGPETVLLDQNLLAEGHEFLHVTNTVVSPDTNLLAYATDYDGGERFTLRVRDLTTGSDLADEVPDVSYGLAWSADSATLFYVRVDESMRPWQLWRHRLGSTVADDVLVHQEDDERFYLHVSGTRTERLVMLVLESKTTSEVWFLDAAGPEGDFQVVEPRRQGVEYGVDHHGVEAGGERFFIVTNADGAENFKLVEAPVTTPGRDHWTEVVGHRPDVKLDGVDVFADHLVLFEKTEGLRRIAVRRLADGTTHT
ncbi:MAG: oligopeptidase B, partial [Acidimicrobiales bacterium]